MTDLFEKIDDYLKGILSDSDRKIFEAELSHNSVLKQAVEDHDVVDSVMDFLVEQDIRSVMNELDKVEDGQKEEYSQERGLPKGLKSYLIFMALSLGALLLAYLFNAQMQKRYSHDKILTAYYSPLTSNNVNRSKASTFESKIDEGIYYYNLRHFDKSKNLLLIPVQNNTDSKKDLKNLYLGHIYLIQNELDSAQIYLTKTKDIRKNEAQAIIYYRTNQIDNLVELSVNFKSEKIDNMVKAAKAWRYKFNKNN
ncbi:MAG: hypothetical protein V3V00_02360 [Saprospiraceae bacterium]